jgi:hypothetical protein
MTTTSLVCTRRLTARVGAATTVELDKVLSRLMNDNICYKIARISAFQGEMCFFRWLEA